MKKVICIHLYNDYSGSPLVLSTAIKGLINNDRVVEVVTSHTEGFLSDLPVQYNYCNYQFFDNRYLRLLAFLFNQLQLFIKVLGYWRQDAVIYVNTLLPFGAALAGWVMRKKVVYHVHETSVQPAILKSFLKRIAQITAKKIIYVSHFLQQQEPIDGVASVVVHNALAKDFILKAEQYQAQAPASKPFVVLMLCSLKDYKGVREFVQLSRQLPAYTFELVLNASEEEIDDYFGPEQLPENLIVFPRQRNVHLFYNRASLVLNLSHPDRWVETFGMTLLEAMQYGVPSIAPPKGGPAEIIEDGVNGYQMSYRQLKEMVAKIRTLATDATLYLQLSTNARKMANKFSVEKMQESVLNQLQ